MPNVDWQQIRQADRDRAYRDARRLAVEMTAKALERVAYVLRDNLRPVVPDRGAECLMQALRDVAEEIREAG